MKEKECYLSNESLKEESFSSNIHNTQLLSDEIRHIPADTEYVIPERYYIDMVVLMPVNLETSFVYWEITQELLNRHHTMIGHLKTKIVSVEDQRGEELAEFPLSTELGKYYLHFKAAMQRMQARIGFYDEEGHFVVILASNIFCMPNEGIEFSDDEVWMSADENTREILRISLQKNSEHLSSQLLFEEKMIELVKLRSLSSGNLIKRGQ